jgi:hypothetical protein
MSLYILVKSILAADPYYQCITHMMPREGADHSEHPHHASPARH